MNLIGNEYDMIITTNAKHIIQNKVMIEIWYVNPCNGKLIQR